MNKRSPNRNKSKRRKRITKQDKIISLAKQRGSLACSVYHKISKVIQKGQKIASKTKTMVEDIIDDEEDFFDLDYAPKDSYLKELLTQNPEISNTKENGTNQAKSGKLGWERINNFFQSEKYYLFNQIIIENQWLKNKSDFAHIIDAMNVLSTQPGLVFRLFEKARICREGVYSVWLNINGKWDQYIIDDYTPVLRRQNQPESEKTDNDQALVVEKSLEDPHWRPYTANSRNKPQESSEFVFSQPQLQNKEIWFCLLEKAMSKAYRGYQNLKHSYENYVVRDLTGAPYSIYEIPFIPRNKPARSSELKEMKEFWSKLKAFLKKGYLLSVCPRIDTDIDALSNQKKIDSAQKFKSGVQNGHNYAVVTIKEVESSFGEGEKIVKLRNPWAEEIWSGDWSHKSSLWTAELKEELGYQPEKRGHAEFWMGLKDFMCYFECLNTYKTMPGYVFNWVEVPISSTSTFSRVVLRVSIPIKGKYTFSVDQKDLRFCGSELLEGIEKYCSIKITFGKIEKRRGFVLLSHTCSNLRNTYIRKMVEKGEYYLLVERCNLNLSRRGIHSEPIVVSSYGPRTCPMKDIGDPGMDGTIFDYLSYHGWKCYSEKKMVKSMIPFDVNFYDGTWNKLSLFMIKIQDSKIYGFKNNNEFGVKLTCIIENIHGVEIVGPEGRVDFEQDFYIEAGQSDIFIMRESELSMATQLSHGGESDANKKYNFQLKSLVGRKFWKKRKNFFSSEKVIENLLRKKGDFDLLTELEKDNELQDGIGLFDMEDDCRKIHKYREMTQRNLEIQIETVDGNEEILDIIKGLRKKREGRSDSRVEFIFNSEEKQNPNSQSKIEDERRKSKNIDKRLRSTPPKPTWKRKSEAMESPTSYQLISTVQLSHSAHNEDSRCLTPRKLSSSTLKKLTKSDSNFRKRRTEKSQTQIQKQQRIEREVSKIKREDLIGLNDEELKHLIDYYGPYVFISIFNVDSELLNKMQEASTKGGEGSKTLDTLQNLLAKQKGKSGNLGGLKAGVSEGNLQKVRSASSLVSPSFGVVLKPLVPVLENMDQWSEKRRLSGGKALQKSPKATKKVNKDTKEGQNAQPRLGSNHNSKSSSEQTKDQKPLKTTKPGQKRGFQGPRPPTKTPNHQRFLQKPRNDSSEPSVKRIQKKLKKNNSSKNFKSYKKNLKIRKKTALEAKIEEDKSILKAKLLRTTANQANQGGNSSKKNNSGEASQPKPSKIFEPEISKFDVNERGLVVKIKQSICSEDDPKNGNKPILRNPPFRKAREGKQFKGIMDLAAKEVSVPVKSPPEDQDGDVLFLTNLELEVDIRGAVAQELSYSRLIHKGEYGLGAKKRKRENKSKKNLFSDFRKGGILGSKLSYKTKIMKTPGHVATGSHGEGFGAKLGKLKKGGLYGSKKSFTGLNKRVGGVGSMNNHRKEPRMRTGKGKQSEPLIKKIQKKVKNRGARNLAGNVTGKNTGTLSRWQSKKGLHRQGKPKENLRRLRMAKSQKKILGGSQSKAGGFKNLEFSRKGATNYKEANSGKNKKIKKKYSNRGYDNVRDALKQSPGSFSPGSSLAQPKPNSRGVDVNQAVLDIRRPRRPKNLTGSYDWKKGGVEDILEAEVGSHKHFSTSKKARTNRNRDSSESNKRGEKVTIKVPRTAMKPSSPKKVKKRHQWSQKKPLNPKLRKQISTSKKHKKRFRSHEKEQQDLTISSSRYTGDPSSGSCTQRRKKQKKGKKSKKKHRKLSNPDFTTEENIWLQNFLRKAKDLKSQNKRAVDDDLKDYLQKKLSPNNPLLVDASSQHARETFDSKRKETSSNKMKISMDSSSFNKSPRKRQSAMEGDSSYLRKGQSGSTERRRTQNQHILVENESLASRGVYDSYDQESEKFMQERVVERLRGYHSKTRTKSVKNASNSARGGGSSRLEKQEAAPIKYHLPHHRTAESQQLSGGVKYSQDQLSSEATRGSRPTPLHRIRTHVVLNSRKNSSNGRESSINRSISKNTQNGPGSTLRGSVQDTSFTGQRYATIKAGELDLSILSHKNWSNWTEKGSFISLKPADSQVAGGGVQRQQNHLEYGSMTQQQQNHLRNRIVARRNRTDRGYTGDNKDLSGVDLGGSRMLNSSHQQAPPPPPPAAAYNTQMSVSSRKGAPEQKSSNHHTINFLSNKRHQIISSGDEGVKAVENQAIPPKPTQKGDNLDDSKIERPVETIVIDGRTGLFDLTKGLARPPSSAYASSSRIQQQVTKSRSRERKMPDLPLNLRDTLQRTLNKKPSGRNPKTEQISDFQEFFLRDSHYHLRQSEAPSDTRTTTIQHHQTSTAQLANTSTLQFTQKIKSSKNISSSLEKVSPAGFFHRNSDQYSSMSRLNLGASKRTAGSRSRSHLRESHPLGSGSRQHHGVHYGGSKESSRKLTTSHFINQSLQGSSTLLQGYGISGAQGVSKQQQGGVRGHLMSVTQSKQALYTSGLSDGEALNQTNRNNTSAVNYRPPSYKGSAVRAGRQGEEQPPGLPPLNQSMSVKRLKKPPKINNSHHLNQSKTNANNQKNVNLDTNPSNNEAKNATSIKNMKKSAQNLISSGEPISANRRPNGGGYGFSVGKTSMISAGSFSNVNVKSSREKSLLAPNKHSSLLPDYLSVVKGSFEQLNSYANPVEGQKLNQNQSQLISRNVTENESGQLKSSHLFIKRGSKPQTSTKSRMVPSRSSHYILQQNSPEKSSSRYPYLIPNIAKMGEQGESKKRTQHHRNLSSKSFTHHKPAGGSILGQVKGVLDLNPASSKRSKSRLKVSVAASGGVNSGLENMKKSVGVEVKNFPDLVGGSSGGGSGVMKPPPPPSKSTSLPQKVLNKFGEKLKVVIDGDGSGGVGHSTSSHFGVLVKDADDKMPEPGRYVPVGAQNQLFEKSKSRYSYNLNKTLK